MSWCAMPSETASSSRSGVKSRAEFTPDTESTVLPGYSPLAISPAMMTANPRPKDPAAPSDVLRTLDTTHQLVASISDISRQFIIDLHSAASNTQLRFQRLVADLAAQLSAVSPDAVDGAIVDSLRKTGEALQLDCAVLWQRNPGEGRALPAHLWVKPSCAWLPEPLSIATIPSVIARLEAGETCCFATLDELPDGDREVFRRCGLRSGAVVAVPPPGEDGVVTALAFASTTREQEWPTAIVERLRLVAGVMGQALARKSSHLALQKARDEIRQLRDQLASTQV